LPTLLKKTQSGSSCPGPGRRNTTTAQEMEIVVGDKVLYSKYAGTDIKLGTEEYVLLSERHSRCRFIAIRQE